MPTRILYRVAVGVLLGFVLGGTPALAQLIVEPQSVAVSVAQYGAETRTVTLTNNSTETLAFCLSFARPLQRSGGRLRLADTVVGTEPCGHYGDTLDRIDEDEIEGPGGWSPYGLTSTPDGRLFTADPGGYRRTYELTADLQFVRHFEHPTVAELTAFARTYGVAYREGSSSTPESDRLWWLNMELSGFFVLRVLLLEGDLSGVPTGRRIEIPIADSGPPPYETGGPVGLSYDGVSGYFFFLDFANDDLWAVDTLGSVVAGYPAEQEAYPGSGLGFGVGAHRGIDPFGGGPAPVAGSTEGVWLEVGMNRPGDGRQTRVVALRAEGSWDGIETPTPLQPDGAQIGGQPVRSLLDPNGVMYYPVETFDVDAIVAVRPHPLPPSWLVVGEQEEGEVSEAWDGVLAPGESREVALTFRPGSRTVGEYTASLQVFEAATGEAVEVPLVLTVVPGVDTEDEATPEETSRLEVYPNPSAGSATVSLTLDAASEVRVVVYDVLGRQVAVLHAGPLGAGEHALAFESAGLPAGLYLVRVEGGVFGASQRLTLVR